MTDQERLELIELIENKLAQLKKMITIEGIILFCLTVAFVVAIIVNYTYITNAIMSVVFGVAISYIVSKNKYLMLLEAKDNLEKK